MSGVCVVASFMYDLVATAPRRPASGETLIGTSFATYVGGKGFNQAVAAARAGAKTAVVGRVGEDSFGAEFHAFLAAEGIDANHLLTDAQHGTGVGLPVVEDSGLNSIIVIPRANQAVTVEDVEAARAAIERSAVLLLQLELPEAPTVHAARIAHEAGATVVLNPAPFAALPAEIRAYVDVLVPNEGELRGLAGDGSGGRAPVLAVAEAVQSEWDCTLVVTLGEEGVLVLDLDVDPVTVPAHVVDVVDTIGAGDTFCGNLGARLAAGDSLIDAVTYGNAAAAIAVTRHGGAPAAPRSDEVDVFVRREFFADSGGIGKRRLTLMARENPIRRAVLQHKIKIFPNGE